MNIVLGVTGSIAAYKAADIISRLKKLGHNIDVILTESGSKIITPLTLQTLSKNKVYMDMFEEITPQEVKHISLAEKADLVLIAPATANIIGKIAHGIADDFLSTVVMAAANQAPIYIAPAMNTNMYENPIVQDNIKKLEHYGFHIIDPASGYLACGDTGAGKMPEAETLYEYIYRDTAYEKDLTGKKILVTAGPTREAIDPVRYITNHSSGKMGYALARVAVARGADVTLVTGPTEIKKPMFVKIVPVTTAKEMFEAVKEEAADADIVCKAAAVADYRPKHIADEKVKKSDSEMSLELEKTDDILKYLGEHRKDGQFLCGFSMETENMVENSRKKLEKKKLDMIAANNLKVAGAGFQGDTNQMTLITKEDETALPLISKEETAACILDKILECMNK